MLYVSCENANLNVFECIAERIASNVGNSTRRQANGLNNHQKTRNNTYDVKKNRLDPPIINHGAFHLAGVFFISLKRKKEIGT